MKSMAYISIVLVILIVGYFILGYVSSYIGWYGYKKWTNRVSAQSLDGFCPYIEKGFKYGYHSSKETRELKNTQFPYQLSFNHRPAPNITVLIRSEDLKKFDSTKSSWGYLRKPTLSDTIVLEIRGEGVQTGIIKVW